MAGLDLGRGSAATGVALAFVLAAVTLWVTAPPDPLPPSAAKTEFSAGRAMAHVEGIAAEIHPIGSVAHGRARDYVFDQLRDLGLDPELQTAWAGEGKGGAVLQGRVENVVARLEGRGDGDTLLLVSHYDSVPTAPGAADAAACAAATLETTRALLAGEPLRNDVIVLVTDGEEAGLLGARAFAAEHPWMAEVDLALNCEARGNSGPVTMFETSEGNARLVSALARMTPYPWASSLSAEVYRRMPNDTDFTVFREAGVAGLNFALVGNHSAYHTELDTPEALDQGSLQHMGSYSLALAQHFGGLDLSTLAAPSDAVYFNPFRFTLVVYPEGLARVMAVLTLVLVTAVLLLGFRRNALDPGGVARGALVGTGVPIVCALVLGALWRMAVQIYPQLTAAPHGDPYEARKVLLGFVLVSIGIAGLIAGMMEASRSGSLRAGVLALWAVVTCGLSFTVVGASYLTLWPALLGAVALTVAVVLRRGLRGQALGLMIVAPIAATAVFTPLVVFVSDALTVAAPILGVLIGLPLAFLLPDLKDSLAGSLTLPVLCILTGVGTLAWVGWSATPGPETPGLTSLLYALDSDKGEASFVSYESEPSDWTAKIFPADLEAGPLPEFLPWRPDARVLTIAAPVLDLAPPTVRLVADSLEGEIRTLTVRVRSERGAPWISLAPDPSMATLLAMGVAGHAVDVETAVDPPLLMIQGVPAAGVEVTFQIEGRQPFSLDVLDVSFGLPEIDGLTIEPRPDHLIRSTHWLSDTTSVYTAAWF